MDKLHLQREVQQPTCIARWLPSAGADVGRIVITVHNADPRLVLVARAWIERATDRLGPTGTAAAVGSGVKWSAYTSLRRVGNHDQQSLKPLDGFAARDVRPATAWQADGTLCAGDEFQISTAGDLEIVISCANVSGTLPATTEQTLFFSLDAFPSDAVAEEDQNPTYDGLLRAVICDCPGIAQLASMPPGPPPGPPT